MKIGFLMSIGVLATVSFPAMAQLTVVYQNDAVLGAGYDMFDPANPIRTPCFHRVREKETGLPENDRYPVEMYESVGSPEFVWDEAGSRESLSKHLDIGISGSYSALMFKAHGKAALAASTRIEKNKVVVVGRQLQNKGIQRFVAPNGQLGGVESLTAAAKKARKNKRHFKMLCGTHYVSSIVHGGGFIFYCLKKYHLSRRRRSFPLMLV